MINRLWRAFLDLRVYRLFPLLIVLLAAGLRFHLLDAQSFWNDEGNTLRLVQRAPADLVAASNRDIHPPGYYLALKVWYALTGDTEFALRAFSALAGTLTVAAVYALGRALFAPGVGMLAALLTALNTFSVYYGQEARMYAPLALLAALSMLAFVRWINRRTPASGLTLALINAAGLYTQYSFPAVMAVQGVMALAAWVWPSSRWGGRRPAPTNPALAFVAVSFLTMLLFLPQLGPAIAQITGWPRGGASADVGEALATITAWLIYGSTFGGSDWTAYLWPGVFALAGLLPDWLRHPGAAVRPAWRRTLPVLWIALTVGAFLALGLFREAYLKFLLPVQIPVALLIGRGVWLLWEVGSPLTFVMVEALPRLAAGFGLLAMLGYYGGALDRLYNDPAYRRDDYRAIARIIASDPRPGDAIILDAPNQQETFTYYYVEKFGGAAPIYPLPEGLGGDDAKTIRDTEAVIAAQRRIFAVFWGEGERDPNRVVEKTLAAQAFEVQTAWYGDVRFVTYAVMPGIGAAFPVGARFGESITLERAAVSAYEVRPGEVLGVALDWRTESLLGARYRVTVQLLDSAGRLAAQRDAEPGNNMALTTTWMPGETVKDTHGLLIPPGLPPGEYTLIVGLYDLNDSAARLPVSQAGAQRNAAQIAQVRMVGSP